MLFSNNKLTRDELLLSTSFHYHPVASLSQWPQRRQCDYQRRRPAARAASAARSVCRHLLFSPSVSRTPPTACQTGANPAVLLTLLDGGGVLRGEVKSELPASPQLSGLLYDLHQQPRFGWRVSLTPLLAQYWQRCDPARRKPRWLRWHQRLRRQGEPRPLRLAPLHMDVHAGNIIHNESGLRLIDWEYAGDGDIALELAAVWITPGEHSGLVEAYARRAAIDAQLLWRQVVLWRPWVLLLMAGWYEMRWRQSGDPQFSLADETWCQLDNERKG